MSKITLGKCLLSYIACAVIFSYFLQTSRGEFDSSEFEVRRRYQDFFWLKEKLEEAHPTLIIPPLPEKFIVKRTVERINDDFIETCRKALHKFLNQIADHRTLTFNEDFKIFLTAQAWVKNCNLYSYNPSVFVHVVGCMLSLFTFLNQVVVTLN